MILKKFSLLIISVALSSLILTFGGAAYEKRINHEYTNNTNSANQSIQNIEDGKQDENSILNAEPNASSTASNATNQNSNQSLSQIPAPAPTSGQSRSTPEGQTSPSVQASDSDKSLSAKPADRSSPIQQEQQQEKPAEKKIINLSIEGVGEYQIDWQEGDTAWKIMQRAAAKFHFAMSYQEFSVGIYIIRLGDKEAQGTYYWALYYNESYSMQGVSDLKVQVNDMIGWKYESFSW